MPESFPRQIRAECSRNTHSDLIQKMGWERLSHIYIERVGSLKKVEWGLVKLSWFFPEVLDNPIHTV